MEISLEEKISEKYHGQEKGMTILPNNYLSNDKEEFHSTTLSFYKYAKSKMEIEYVTEPEILIEQRSGDWFGPVLMFTSIALRENPALISIACSVIANFVTDFLKGEKKQNIRLKVLYKETKSTKITEICYEGGLEGLASLEKSILEVASKSSDE